MILFNTKFRFQINALLLHLLLLQVVCSIAPFAPAQSPLEQLENKLRNKSVPNAEAVPPPPAEELPGPDRSGPKLTPPAEPTPDPVFLGMEVEALGPDELGVLVTEVFEKSPAWKAGLMVGDRLLGFNGEAIDDLEFFSRRLASTKPGDTIRFIVDRNGRNMAVPVIAQRFDIADRLGNVPRPLGNMPPLEIPSGDETIPMLEESRSWLGCSVADLSEKWRRQFSIPAYRGAAVSDVVAKSPAASAGIKPGDVIIEIGGRSIESARDLTQWLSEVRPGTPVKVSYFRGLTAKVGELTVGSIQAPPDSLENIPAIQDQSRPNLEALPVPDQIEFLRAEIFDMQERLLELQRELDRLQRSVGPPK